MSQSIDYETDRYEWALYHVQLLREGRLSELDIEHLIEALEDMGKSDRRALENRFIILIAHLLKWAYQPDQRSNSWESTINEQRLRISRLIRQEPSLKRYLLEAISDAYPDAVTLASDDSGLAKSHFPEVCPYSQEQLLEKKFFPQAKNRDESI